MQVMRHALRRRGRSGFTLLELVVVMFILMALAAIIVPLFPSMVERAHRASQASNESEITKSVQLYQGLYGNYPDGYDLLTDGSAMINYLPANDTASPMFYGETVTATPNLLGFGYPCGGYIHASTLTANALSALNGAGIISEYALANTASMPPGGGNAAIAPATSATNWQPTFNPYISDVMTGTGSGQTTLTNNTEVVYVNPSGIQVAGLGSPSIMNPASTTQFVMFGLGKRCSMIGTVMSNAGSNFPNDAVHENPDIVYQRFGLIYQVEDAHGNALPSAVCLGAVAIEANILLATDGTMASYSQNVPQIGAVGRAWAVTRLHLDDV